MDGKLKISSLWVWIIALLLGILGVIFLTQIWMEHQVPLEAPSSTGALNSQPVYKEPEFPSQINRENNPVSTAGTIAKGVNPEVMAVETAVTPNEPASVQETSLAPEQSSPSLPGQAAHIRAAQQKTQAAQPAGSISVNVPMTDQQILEGIQQQNKSQEALLQAITKRDATATQVIRGAQTAQIQSTNSQEVIPSSYSNPVAPADVQAKLKSHQLTAH